MSTPADLKAQKRQKFEHVYTVIREELLAHFDGEGMPKDASEWYRAVSTIPKSMISNSGDEKTLELGLQRPRWQTQPRHVSGRYCGDLERIEPDG